MGLSLVGLLRILLFLALLSVIAVLIMGSNHSAERAPQPVHIRVLAIEYPPFTSAGTDGDGLSFRLLNQLLKPYNWYAGAEYLPPARAPLAVNKSSGWLASFFPARADSEHAQVITLAPAAIRMGLFRQRQQTPFRWSSLDELKGKTLATIRSGSAGAFITPFIDAGMQPVFVNNLDQGILMLAEGRVDYVLSVEDTGWYYAGLHKLDVNRLQFSDTIISTFPHVVYVNREHPQGPQLIRLLQEAVR